MNKTSEQEIKIFSLISNNGYHTRSQAVKSIGFRMSSLCYSERGNLYNLAEDYLSNSFLRRNDAEIENSISSYLQDDGMKLVSMIGQEDFSDFPMIQLTEGLPLDLSLGEAINRRRSYRNFTGDPIQMDQLATLMRASGGISAIAEAPLTKDGQVKFHLRTVPSGGGLYPIELYFAAINVNHLTKGIYRYRPLTDHLIQIGDHHQLASLLLAFEGSGNLVKDSHASLVMLFVAKPWRSMRKYGNRGLRFVFQEIGSISQNLHLAVSSLGLGSVDCASFYEDEAHQVLSFDGISQILLHTQLVGVIP